jgi:hypothetical protein
MKIVYPNIDEEVLLYAPDWSDKWVIGWRDKNRKWWVDPKDEPPRCITDEKCDVVAWQETPPIPDKTQWTIY